MQLGKIPSCGKNSFLWVFRFLVKTILNISANIHRNSSVFSVTNGMESIKLCSKINFPELPYDLLYKIRFSNEQIFLPTATKKNPFISNSKQFTRCSFQFVFLTQLYKLYFLNSGKISPKQDFAVIGKRKTRICKNAFMIHC